MQNQARTSMETLIKIFYWLYTLGCVSFLIIGFATGKINYSDYGVWTFFIALGAYVIGVLVGAGFAMRIESSGIQIFFLLLAFIPLAVLLYVILTFNAIFNPHYYFFGGSFVLGMLTAGTVAAAQ